MELQTIYTQVLQHLARQGEAAISEEGNCQYLDNMGRKCAVGCLIPAAAYYPNLEGASVNSPNLANILSPADKLVIELGIATTDAHRSLLSELQTLHDQYMPQPHTVFSKHVPFNATGAVRLLEGMEKRYSVIRPKAFNVQFGL